MPAYLILFSFFALLSSAFSDKVMVLVWNPNTLMGQSAAEKTRGLPERFEAIRDCTWPSEKSQAEPEPILTKSELGCGADKIAC